MNDLDFRSGVFARYFFRVTRNGACIGRSDGLAFADKAAAWREAALSFGEIIGEMDGEIEPGCHWQMRVSDDSGKPIYRLTFTAEEVWVRSWIGCPSTRRPRAGH